MEANYTNYLRNEYPDSFSTEPFATLIYKKINKQIPSTNEMNNYSLLDRRPEFEKSIIHAVIYEYIHVDMDVIYLIDPFQHEAGLLLKMTKSGINYVIDESKPFIFKGLGTSLDKFGAEIGVKTAWAIYLNKLSGSTSKLWRSPKSIKSGRVLSKLLGRYGKSLYNVGKFIDGIGTATLVYDVLSTDSPSLVNPDTLIESTQKQLSNLCQRKHPYNLL